jgi:hypothetical protein
MWRYIIAAPFLIHGLAHISGFLAAWTSSEAGYKKNPWILSSDIYLDNPIGKVFGMLWLVAMFGFISSAIGIVFQLDWWSNVAIASSLISLVVIVPWWNTVPPGAKVGAIFDVIVIVVLLLPIGKQLFEMVS